MRTKRLNNESRDRFTSWLPGVVLVGERYRANALGDEVNWEGHLEESPHRAWIESGLLK